MKLKLKLQLKTNHTPFNSEEIKVGEIMRHFMSTYVFAVFLITIAVSLKVQAATPGLPFTEDFNNTNLQDGTQTSANWDTKAEQLTFGAWQRQFGVLQSVDTADISDDENDTAALALGDVDGDGDLDVIAGNDDGINRLYLNNGSRVPFGDVTGSDIGVATNDTRALALGDVDGDGDLDVIAGNNNGINRLYLNNGSAAPFNGVVSSNIGVESNGTRALALGDVDGDGDLDVIAGNNGAQTSRLYLNNGSNAPFNGVTGSNVGAGGSVTRALALGDVDGDGDLDLIEGNRNQRNLLVLNNGSADPYNGVTGVIVGGEFNNTRTIALGDVDGDGDLDVIEGNLNEPNRLIFNDGSVTPFEFPVSRNIGLRVSDTRAIMLGDMDGDGDLDIIVGNRNQSNLLVLNNGSVDPFNGAVGTTISSGSNATHALALGDVDGDGDLDVIAGNVDGQRNQLALNNGDPSPFSRVAVRDIYDDVNATQALALGDVDGDGDLDVVAGNVSDQMNRLYLNNGSTDPFNGVTGRNVGTVESATNAIALGDVDGDGDLDVIEGNFNQMNRLVLNNGSADPFNGVTGSNISADVNNTTALALGDVDGDGDLDIVVGNENETNRLILNNGSDTPFVSAIPSNVSEDEHRTHALALGDMDGDGDLDVIVGNLNETNRLVLNNGSVNPFTGVAGSDISDDSSSTVTLALGDMDGDGDLDVITGNQNETNRLALNNGSDAPFNDVVSSNISTDADSTEALVLGDVDGDGDLDVITGSNNGTQHLYLNNDSNAPFNDVVGQQINATTNLTRALALGDVDGDGDLDLFIASLGQNNQVILSGAVASPFNILVKSDISVDKNPTRALALGDVDGDGDIDVIEGNFGRRNRLYLNNGSRDPFDGAVGSDIGTSINGTFAVALGDVDGDGDLDVITGNANQRNQLFLNNGSSAPFSSVTGVDITADSNSTRAIALGDVNGDGHLDLIVVNDIEGNRLYLNNGSSAPFSGVTGSDISSNGNPSRVVALGDVDGDGDLDVITGNLNRRSQLVLNNGSGAPFNGVASSDISTEANSTIALALNDVDGDGDLDVVAGNLNERNRLYLNNGGVNPFNDVIGRDLGTESNATFDLALGDIDGDGDIDVVEGNLGQTNRLLLNNGSASPFDKAVVRDTDAESNDTFVVTLSDVNGDGNLDLMEGNNSATNRLLSRGPRFDLQASRVTSLETDASAANINTVVLSAVQATPVNTSIDYFLSNNGGRHWFQTKSGASFDFPTTGNDLRWRAQLRSRSPALTPTLSEINVSLSALTLAVNNTELSEADEPDTTIATVSVNFDTRSDVLVILTSSDITEITVPAMVTIPAGQRSSAPFPIEVVDDTLIDNLQTVTLMASANLLISNNVVVAVRDDDDNDGDGIAKNIDNCPDRVNVDQADFEGDGTGDICDADDDNDGLPDDYELTNGLNPRNASDGSADADGDGFSNKEEFEFGSNPNIADTDENDNGVPDVVESRASAIVPILQLLLFDDFE